MHSGCDTKAVNRPGAAPLRASRRGQRGQSLIVAVIVMFVLLFIGGIFVGIVAHNLLNSGRTRDTVEAAQFAEAGIKYCDTYLQNSPDGADWRPALTPIAQVNPNDPDYRWLAAGYTRVDLGGGRALVRVSYGPALIQDPSAALPCSNATPQNCLLDPLGKYIKIESVGRVGTINPNDPTSFLNNPAPRLRREYVAYKAIGLLDYLRFVTNANNDTKAVAFFGIQPFGIPLVMQFGGYPQRTFGTPLPPFLKTPGAPMMINNDVEFGNNLVLAVDPRDGEQVRVAGDVTVDSEQQNDPAKLGARLLDLSQTAANTDPTSPAAQKIRASNDPTYSTFGSLLVDAGQNPDPQGHARGTSRLDPPILDAPDQATGLPRYRELTRNSGRFLTVGNQTFDLGRVGLGTGLYIDNFDNMEQETRNVAGGQSLRSLWLNPYGSPRWNGPYYIPPGATLEFGYPIAHYRDDNTDQAGDFRPLPGFRVVRDTSNSPSYFRDLQGVQSSVSTLDFTYFIYKPAGQPPVLKIETPFYRDALKNALNMSDKDVDKFLPAFSGVIYAEGNLRVRGLLADSNNIPIRRENPGEPNPMTDADIRAEVHPSITAVSGGNIYVEGSLVRESARSMIALLAVQNVVVNTTMFVSAPANQLAFRAASDGTPYVDLGSTNANQAQMTLDFLLGDDPASYKDLNGAGVPTMLLMRHGVETATTPAQTFINLLVNEWSPRPAAPPALPALPPPLFDFFNGGSFEFPGYPGNPPWPTNPPLQNGQTYPISASAVDVFGHPFLSNGFEGTSFQLFPKPNNANYLFTGDPGYQWPQGLRDTIRPVVDESFAANSLAGLSSYWFARAAVVPMDVRIEAVMYAQNGSFFIIPGVPFNQQANDTRARARAAAVAYSPNVAANAMIRPDGMRDIFPFYDEPVDCRITVVGAISENRTASASDQGMWTQLWGWIPQVYGSTGADPRPGAPNQQRQIPAPHVFGDDVNGPSLDMRSQSEKTFYDAANQVGIARGIRFLYDPALVAPYNGYDPRNAAFRTDFSSFDPTKPNAPQGRTLPPVPRLPVCPGFVFNGEVR